MDPAVYWRSALGLFWAFMFFTLMALVVLMRHLSKLEFYPYAVLLSAILLLFLTGFLLFGRRIVAGLYMCLGLSSLFVLNQLITLYLLFFRPTDILPADIFIKLAGSEAIFFPSVVSFLLLIWAGFLLTATWRSRPVFQKEMKMEQLRWLIEMKKETLAPAKKPAEAKKPLQ